MPLNELSSSDDPDVKPSSKKISADPQSEASSAPVKPSSVTPIPNKSFFISCNGIELSSLAVEISQYFNVNIFVFDDIKDRKIYGEIKGVSLKQVLDAVCWYLGVEYVFREDIYYIGSNSKVVVVLPSSGLDAKVEQIFQDVNIKQINDKLVIYGEERAVARVQGVYQDLVKQDYCVVKFYAFEIMWDKNLTFGIDLEQSVKYAFSWENLISNSYNPIQSLAVSLYASLEVDSDQLRIYSLIDTNLGMLSGEKVRLQVGQDEDRPVYSQSETGDRVVSSYDTQSTGLILDLTASFDGSYWIFDVDIENSDSQSSTRKTVTKLTSKSRLSKSDPVSVLAQLNMQQTKESYEKGIPFLCDIPFLGYLFRVSTDREMERKIFFVVSLVPASSSEYPTGIKFGSLLIEFSRKISTLLEF